MCAMYCHQMMTQIQGYQVLLFSKGGGEQGRNRETCKLTIKKQTAGHSTWEINSQILILKHIVLRLLLRSIDLIACAKP